MPTCAGISAIAGGAIGLALAPVMVIIKYMTGWTVIPEPSWVGAARQAMGGLLDFAAPARLWTAYGTGYTVALLLMLFGFVGVFHGLWRPARRLQSAAYWIVVAGLCLVIPGDAVHTWTWHQNGLTVPTPGTNPVANTAYAVHMMGMNFVMVGSLMLGVSALRRRSLARWLAWSFVLIFPSAVLASLTLLPTTPSGALWLFSLTMVACGCFVATGRMDRLVPVNR